jgi:uncharacterized protein (UPF0548 family)
VADPAARIVVNQLVAVEARTLGLWTLNVSRILAVVDTPLRFGFVYATTPLHVEEGEIPARTQQGIVQRDLQA